MSCARANERRFLFTLSLVQETQAAQGRNVFWRKTIWWLFALFIISVAIRIPNLNRPLSKHHEFCTALTLIIVQAWKDEGITSRNFNPSTTFSLPADKFINNCSMDTMQRDGHFFYLSHPPLAYYVPYAVFRILHIAASPLGLQIINLGFEFITIVFIYLITSLILRDHWRQSVSIPSLIAASICLFLPVTLWFHSNAYMADMFVQNFWAPALFITLKIFLERKERSRRWLGAFGISIFLMTYTDWLGALFAGAVTTAALYHLVIRKEKSFLSLSAIAVIIPVLTVSLVLFQYASIAGWNALMFCYGYRYAERGSLNWNNFSGFLSVIDDVVFNYVVSYAPVLPILGLLLIKRKSLIAKIPNLKLFAGLTLFPVLLDHAIFLRYAVQDFGVLKASFFFSIAAALTIDSVFPEKNIPSFNSPLRKPGFRQSPGNRRAKSLTIAVVSLAGAIVYLLINHPGEVSFKGDPYNAEMKTGAFIRANANPDEVVFLQDAEATPQIIWYAHRNIKEVRSDEEAIAFLRGHSETRGVLFSAKHDSLAIARIIQ